jgi:hypothetical protein
MPRFRVPPPPDGLITVLMFVLPWGFVIAYAYR